MKKKIIITSFTALGLSFGIFGATNAEEAPRVVTPTTSGGTLIAEEVSPYNVQRTHREFRRYPKSEYPMSSQTPASHFITTTDGYYGTIYKYGTPEPVGTNGDWWQVEYRGTLTKFDH